MTGGSRCPSTRRATTNLRFVGSSRRCDTRHHERSRAAVHGTVANSCQGRGVAVTDRVESWGDWLGRQIWAIRPRYQKGASCRPRAHELEAPDLTSDRRSIG